MDELPAIDSFVRRAVPEDGQRDLVGRVVHYIDDSVDRTGPSGVVVRFLEPGIGIYLPEELIPATGDDLPRQAP